MNFTPVEIWLVVGTIFILIEFSTTPGIGFLFVGFGALSTAILIYNLPQFLDYQIVAVGLFSILWFIILWRPLKLYVYGEKGKKKDYFDIVGSEVKVFASLIRPGDTGQVLWSGTIMNARVCDNESQEAVVGQTLYVIEVKGNILLCSSTKPEV